MDGLEYAVDDAAGKERIFTEFDAAAGFAVAVAASGKENVHIDTLCWNRAAAVAAGLAEEYDGDPEASVTCRLTIKVERVGRIA
jgi:hypothetical protein